MKEKTSQQGEENNAGSSEIVLDEAAADTDGDQGKTGDDNAPPQSGKDGDKTLQTNEGDISVFSETRKGKTIIGVTGKPITFDSEGNAKVSKMDAEYLKNCPGFKFAQ